MVDQTIIKEIITDHIKRNPNILFSKEKVELTIPEDKIESLMFGKNAIVTKHPKGTIKARQNGLRAHQVGNPHRDPGFNKLKQDIVKELPKNILKEDIINYDCVTCGRHYKTQRGYNNHKCK